MAKIIAIIAIVALGWFIYDGGIEKIKNSTMQAIQNDKTMQAVNKSIETNQTAVNHTK